MKKLFFLFTIHPVSLAVWTLVVMAMVVTTGWAHFATLSLAFETGIFDADVTLEEDVAVILVAFGVFLEMREMLAKRAYGEEIAEKQHELNELSERYGAYLLIIGLIMEINDQCFEPLLEDTFVAAFGVASMAFFDALALIMGIAFLAKLCVPSRHVAA
ncbi:MAG: hypothetical protein ACMZ66_01280 [Thalassospira sp.]|uniref:hypothetical protein n=1 Tax=Thalassospira sp. TaxID=1912094 RepID=UPI003A83C8E9